MPTAQNRRGMKERIERRKKMDAAQCWVVLAAAASVSPRPHRPQPQPPLTAMTPTPATRKRGRPPKAASASPSPPASASKRGRHPKAAAATAAAAAAAQDLAACQGRRKDGTACNRKAKGDCAHGRCVACCEKLAQPCAAHEALIKKRQGRSVGLSGGGWVGGLSQRRGFI